MNRDYLINYESAEFEETRALSENLVNRFDDLDLVDLQKSPAPLNSE